MDRPVMAASNKKARRVWDIWQEYQSERSEWEKEAAENEDFFMGRQWTTKEIRTLEERGMAPLVVNRTHPVIMQEIAILTSKRPQLKYFGRDDSDTALAAMWSDAATYVWDQSQGDLQYIQAIQDMLVTGAGYLQAYIDGYADDGRGEVYIKSLPPYDVYPDPNAREIDLSDARAIFVSRRMDKDAVKTMFPDMTSRVSRAVPDEGPVMDRPAINPRTKGSGFTVSDVEFYGIEIQNQKVRVIEMYEKIKVPYYRLINIKMGTAEVVQADGFDASLVHENIDIVPFWRDQVRLTITLGYSAVMFEGMLPTSEYPIIPFYLHHARNPYPMGDVAIIKGMQQEINKRRSIMIHNATLSGNHRWLAEEGQLVNEEEFKRTGSRPGSILKWRFTGSGQAPREVLPQQLPSAWIQLESEAKQDLEYAVSVFSHMMGSNQDAPETYRGLLALEEAGQRKIQHKAMHARLGLRRLGRVLFDYMRYTYQHPKILRIAGEENEDYRSVYMNQMKLNPETGEVVTYNDASVGQFDLVVVDGSSMPTNRMALLNLYLEMFQLGIVDKEEVLKKTDVVNKEAVIQRMGEIAQLSAQVEQAGQTIKDLQGLNQTIRRQLQQSEVQQDVLKGGEAIREQVSRTQMTQELTRQRMQDELKIIKKEAQLALAESKLASAGYAAQSRLKAMMEHEKAKLEAAAIKANAKPKTEAK